MLPQLLWSGIWVVPKSKGLPRGLTHTSRHYGISLQSMCIYPFAHIFPLNVCNTMPKQLVYLTFTLKAQFEETLISGIQKLNSEEMNPFCQYMETLLKWLRYMYFNYIYIFVMHPNKSWYLGNSLLSIMYLHCYPSCTFVVIHHIQPLLPLSDSFCCSSWLCTLKSVLDPGSLWWVDDTSNFLA